MRRRALAAAACLLMAAALPNLAAAQDVGLSPTLAAIKASKTVRLGYREASLPFSFLEEAKRPIGYSLELCQAIVEEIGVAVDDPALEVEYVPVTPETRIPALLDKKIDLECGSTTANAERRQRVAFSPLIFVAGTKLMVAKASPVASITDLKFRTNVNTLEKSPAKSLELNEVGTATIATDKPIAFDLIT